MKSLKQVMETGEYKTKKDESSSEEEYEQNASDDDWDQVDVETSSSEDTSDQSLVCTSRRILPAGTKGLHV